MSPLAQWKAVYENVTKNKEPKTGPADFVQDLELFAEVARLVREPWLQPQNRPIGVSRDGWMVPE